MIIKKLNLKFLTLIFFVIFLFQASYAININFIKNLRLIEMGNNVSIIFDANKPIYYSLKQSKNEIIIVVKNAKLTALLNKTWLTKTPVLSIASKQFGKNLHLILKLKNPVKLRHNKLKNPSCLVLDFIAENTDNIVQSTSINDEKIDEIERQIALQITTANPELSSSSEMREIQKNSDLFDFATEQQYGSEQLLLKKSTDVVNIINTGNNISNNKSRNITIVIDPGHGGKDPGAIGFSGVQEKDINLAVSKCLEKEINSNKGFKAILTRKGDSFIELHKRLGIAHYHKADMFVAIHADAYISETARGVSVFALSQKEATSNAARWLAKKENESELGRSLSNKSNSLKSVLVNLAQDATISTSLEIGKSLLSGFSQFADLHSNKVEQAAFVVLKSPDIPSLLVETGFISDPYEESRLKNPKYQKRIASCLALGITEYFANRPPRDTYLAKLKNKNNSGKF